jgi:hypothetical protein
MDVNLDQRISLIFNELFQKRHETISYSMRYCCNCISYDWNNNNDDISSIICRRKTALPALIATSDENVYVVWGNNDTANTNSEVMFRASIDGGQTYADKVNLSNSTGSNSTDFDVEATIDNVIVSWWETNQTSAEPVIVFSGDRGATFGPILRLASNGTISG